MTPSTEPAIRIAQLFNRRLTTNWGDREIRQYKKLVKGKAFQDLSDLTLLERYYRSERQKGDKGIHRRDLQTFLNNFHGELDRAKAWGNRRGSDYRRVMNDLRILPNEQPATDDEWKQIGNLAKAELERFRKSLNHA